MTKKIIILLDSLEINIWISSIINHILEVPNLEIIAYVINQYPLSSKSSFTYRLLRKLDRYIFPFKPNPFQKTRLDASTNQILVVHPIQNKYSDRFDQDDLNKIKTLQPDLIIRFGFRILRGEILNVAKHGVWSLHHGDNRVNRGGPPAFWEIVNRENITGVTLQRLSEDLDGGVILGKAFVKTNLTSFNRNQAALFWTGVELFKKGLLQLTKGTLPLRSKEKLEVYDRPLYLNPNNIDAFRIGLRFFSTTLLRKIDDFFYREEWSIAFSFRESPETSFFRFSEFSSPGKTNWADPFICFWQNKYYLFFEEFKNGQAGEIAYAIFDPKTKTFSQPKVILSESFHLSYPFVFEDYGDMYMIPESGATGKVCLYKATTFPEEWKLEHVLFTDKKMYDVTILLEGDYYYLFATVKPNEGLSANEILEIYYSDSLITDKWIPHPQNPIKMDVRGARSAGKIQKYDGTYLRPAQICTEKYGYAIQFFRIQELTPISYSEVPLFLIEPKWKKNLLATHTFNREEQLTVVDFQEKKARFW